MKKIIGQIREPQFAPPGRRNFLKSAGMGAAGIAGSGLMLFQNSGDPLAGALKLMDDVVEALD